MKSSETSFFLPKHPSRKTVDHLLFFFLLFLLASNLFLYGEGFLAFPDEFRFLQSYRLLQSLGKLDIKMAFHHMFSTHGRPIDALVNVVPIFLMKIHSHVVSVQLFSRENFSVLFCINFLILTINTLMVFAFASQALSSRTYGYLCAVFFLLSTNSTLYLRHALPYDFALFVFLLLVFSLLKHKVHSRVTSRHVLYGIFSAIGFLAYPGYFPMVPLVLALSILNEKVFGTRFFWGAFMFGFGFLVMVLSAEAIAWFGGNSYLKVMYSLSDSIDQGDFNEGFSFLLSYWLEVEKGWGVAAVVLFSIGFSVLMVQKIKHKEVGNAHLFVLLFWLVFSVLAYSANCYFFHRMVWYGRIWHQFLPFFCLGSVYGLKVIERKWTSFAVVLVLFANQFFSKWPVLEVSYPEDFINNCNKEFKLTCAKVTCEFEDGMKIYSKVDTFSKKTSKYQYVNTCYFYPMHQPISKKVEVREEGKILKSEPHFLNFKAYQFEGFGPAQRRNLDEADISMRLIFE